MSIKKTCKASIFLYVGYSNSLKIFKITSMKHTIKYRNIDLKINNATCINVSHKVFWNLDI